MILLFACAGEPADTDAPAAGEDYVDARIAEGDYQALSGLDVALEGPDMVVEPGDDVMVCRFGTYEGDDVGIHQLVTYQATWGHHLLLMGTTASEIDHPDGEQLDCGDGGALSMAELEPIMIPTRTYLDGVDLELGIDLAEGMAVKLDRGQRYVLQSHYVNSGTEPMRVRDIAVIEALAEDEVETWAAPLILNNDAFTLPPGEATDVAFDCEVPSDYNVLYWTGHMHEWGTSFKLERVLENDGVEPIYAVDEWEPSYRDTPPIDVYAPGEFPLPAGTVLRTTCSYFNDRDEALTFPHEMCDSVSVVYPQLTAVICNNGSLD
ncbi:MAG: hypothetical protein ACOZNI_02240 [Myxococcota bacterium]